MDYVLRRFQLDDDILATNNPNFSSEEFQSFINNNARDVAFANIQAIPSEFVR